MNKAQAVAKLSKAIGKNFAYRVDPKALDAEGREKALEEFRVLRAEKEDVQAKLEARRKELLDDPLFISLSKRYKELGEQCNNRSYYAHHKRISVGQSSTFAFHVKAEGDNWAEVVQKVIGG